MYHAHVHWNPFRTPLLFFFFFYFAFIAPSRWKSAHLIMKVIELTFASCLQHSDGCYFQGCRRQCGGGVRHIFKKILPNISLLHHLFQVLYIPHCKSQECLLKLSSNCWPLTSNYHQHLSLSSLTRNLWKNLALCGKKQKYIPNMYEN